MVDDPNLGELGRKIEDFRRDVRDDFTSINARLDTFVLREVYAVDKAANDARVGRLERENEAARTAARNALYAAAGSVLASIIAGVIMAVLMKGGG